MPDPLHHAILERVSSAIESLPEEDLPIVLEFVENLKRLQARAPGDRQSLSAIRAEARRRAALLKDVPRSEVIPRFVKLAEEIRETALRQGTACEEDWTGD